MATIPNAGPYVEFSIEDESYYPWQYDIYGPMPQVTDGHVELPNTPGWGIDIRPEWLAKSCYQRSDSKNRYSHAYMDFDDPEHTRN